MRVTRENLSTCKALVDFWDDHVIIPSVRVFYGHPSLQKKPLMVMLLMPDDFNVFKTHYKCLYISLPSSAKQQLEMTKFSDVFGTWTTTGDFWYFHLELNAVVAYLASARFRAIGVPIGVRAGGVRGAAAPPVTEVFEIFRAKR